MAEVVVFGSVVEVGVACRVKMPRQSGAALIEFKDEPLQGHPLLGIEDKGFVAKNNGIHLAGEQNKAMHPSHNGIPSSPRPENDFLQQEGSI